MLLEIRKTMEREYQIVLQGRGTTIAKGTSPQEAFKRVFPSIDLIPTKNKALATVQIRLFSNLNARSNYYIAKSKTQIIKTFMKSGGYEKGISSNIKSKVEKLIQEGLTLTSFNYSDITDIRGGSGLIVALEFGFTTKMSRGAFVVGNIPFEFYTDDGDICIDFSSDFSDLLMENEKIKTKFDWFSLTSEIIEAVEPYCD